MGEFGGQTGGVMRKFNILLWLFYTACIFFTVLLVLSEFGGQTSHAQQQYAITTPARVTGDAAAHALATTGTARWVLIVAEAGNASPVRCGDSNVSSTRGVPIYASSTSGGGYQIPPATVNQS